jgi:large subunit ribosomal protein L10
MKTGEVSQWKQDTVKKVVAEIKENPIVGIVNFEGLPSKQLLQIKHSLREHAIIRMARKRLIKLVLKQAGIEGLNEHLKGEPALILTKSNPFMIAKKLRESRTFAAAKPGATMPKDIIVPAGETSFAPGPIVGELGSMGVKAAIDKGKVVIKVDSVLAKEGEKIDKKKADLMSKMGIEPIEIGLDIQAAIENGLVYQSDVLGINTEQLVDDMTNAASDCFKLSIGIGFPTAQNITFLVQKSWNGAKALATEINYLCKATAGDVLAKAEAGMDELKKLVKEPADEGKADKGEEKTDGEDKKMTEEEQPTEEKQDNVQTSKSDTGQVLKPEKPDKLQEAPAEETPAEAPAEEAPKEEASTEEPKPEAEAPTEEPAPAAEEKPAEEEKPTEEKKEEPKPKAEEDGLLDKISDKVGDVVEAVEEKLHIKKDEEKEEEKPAEPANE